MFNKFQIFPGDVYIYKAFFFLQVQVRLGGKAAPRSERMKLFLELDRPQRDLASTVWFSPIASSHLPFAPYLCWRREGHLRVQKQLDLGL